MQPTFAHQPLIKPSAADAASWANEESKASHFPDGRLKTRFGTLLEQMFEGFGRSVPVACQDWANIKAAYRFLSNPRVNEAQILAGHFQSTQERFETTQGPVLILHDTTEFTFQREKAPPKVASTRRARRKSKDRRVLRYTARSIMMHASLATTPEGLPLGLTATKVWSRKKFTGNNALEKNTGPTRLPAKRKESLRWPENLRQTNKLLKAPERCVHVGDRESDIHEVFCAAQEDGSFFVVRTCVDRLIGDGEQTIATHMEEAPVRGFYRLKSRTKSGECYEADLEIKYELLRVQPPLKQLHRAPELLLSVIYATEVGDPQPPGRERIAWKLITNLPVNSLGEAIEKLEWYASRWKIETFHKILKSGCKVEESKLRTSERMVNLIAIFCIVSWRIFWMTMLQRTEPEAPPEAAFTPTEIALLDHLKPGKPWDPPPRRTICEYLLKVAKLGGYLARKSDPPPGNMVMWRGMTRLIDIQLGFEIGAGNYG